MPHNHLRTEKTCLNCAAAIPDRYCSVCGQENTDPHESVWHLVRHFFEDLTHFDGKFFKTVKLLFTKPGFLAKEYTKGRRASYLHPVRMYLLTSAIFLLVIFSIIKPEHYDARTAFLRDSLEQYNPGTNLGVTTINDSTEKPMTTVSVLRFPKAYAINGVHVYDSIQKALPGSEKDGLFDQYLDRRMAAAATVYHRDANGFMMKFFEDVLHSLSKVFFISIPFFALILLLLHARRREFSVVGHVVFSLYFYCAAFLFILLILVLSQIAYDVHGILLCLVSFLAGASIIGVFVYLYIAMLQFYKQGWFITLLKFFSQTVLFITVFIFIFIAVFLNSIMSLANA